MMNGEQHICQVAFCAFDAPALRKWYLEIFDFLPSGKIVFFPPGSTRVQGIAKSTSKCSWLIDSQDYFQLEFFQFYIPLSKPRPYNWKPSDIGYNILGFQVSEFDLTLDRLKLRGHDCLTSPQGKVGERRVCVKDPEGNIIEIFESYPHDFDEGGLVRPEVPVTVRSMIVSVPDLEPARHYFSDVLGLEPVAGETLHNATHEALWGLDGAKSERLLLRSKNFLVELVCYTDPEPRPWPDGYQICDQGFMNIALGYNETSAFDTAFKKAVDGGARPNGKPLDAVVFKVMYVNDSAGFSVEMLNARKSLWSVTGFKPSVSYVENEVWIAAPPEAVWPVITDHAAMGDWMPFKGKLLRTGEDDHNGKGALRELKGMGMKIVEEVTQWRFEKSYTYRLTGGAPVKNHRGDVTLTEENGGTRVRWSIQFKSKIPGAGKIIATALKLTFKKALLTLKKRLEK